MGYTDDLIRITCTDYLISTCYTNYVIRIIHTDYVIRNFFKIINKLILFICLNSKCFFIYKKYYFDFCF